MHERRLITDRTGLLRFVAAPLLLCNFICLVSAAEISDFEIYTAIRNDDLARLKSIFSSGVDPNRKDGREATPLMHAAAIGSIGALKLLLAAGADPNAQDGFGITPLMYGLRDIARVLLLLEAGARANAKSKQEQTPLLIAAANPGSM